MEMVGIPKVVPMTQIMLDKPRVLRCDIAALKRFRLAVGKPITEFISGRETLEPEQTCALLWACLLYDDPSLKQEQVDAMVDLGMLTDIGNTITELIIASFPKQPETAQEDTPDPNSHSLPIA